MTRPIPRQPAPRPPLTGWWMGTVVSITDQDGLTVNIPALSGGDGRHTGCYSAVFDPALAGGDPVWVTNVNGSRDLFIVTARRTT